jgi:hypothetical protein
MCGLHNKRRSRYLTHSTFRRDTQRDRHRSLYDSLAFVERRGVGGSAQWLTALFDDRWQGVVNQFCLASYDSR